MKKIAIVAVALAALTLTGCSADLSKAPTYETGVNWTNSLIAASGKSAARDTMVQLYGSVQKACAAVVTVQVPKLEPGLATDAWIAGCSSVFE